jgi:hypothetical protein
MQLLRNGEHRKYIRRRYDLGFPVTIVPRYSLKCADEESLNVYTKLIQICNFKNSSLLTLQRHQQEGEMWNDPRGMSSLNAPTVVTYFALHWLQWPRGKVKTKLSGMSPQAKYTDRATAASEPS